MKIAQPNGGGTFRPSEVVTWLALAVLFSHGSPLGGQVRGRVLSTAAVPVEGAIVQFTDSTGAVVGRAVTTPSGAYALKRPTLGPITIRAIAIGYLPASIVAGSGSASLVADIVMSPAVFSLRDIVATGTRRYCGDLIDNSTQFMTLLTAAQISLQVMEATIEEAGLRFQTRLVTTRTRLNGDTIDADTVQRVAATWPVESWDPDSLRMFGFAVPLTGGKPGEYQVFGPDARVLFADWFLESHCFALGKRSPGDRLEVEFTPRRGRTTVDVRGVLSIDRQTMALRRLEFTLISPRADLRLGPVGGEMFFTVSNDGMWIANEWAMWAPILVPAGNRRLPQVVGRREVRGTVERILDGSKPVEKRASAPVTPSTPTGQQHASR